MSYLRPALRRFRRSEEGSFAVEFALFVPLMIGVLLSAATTGYLNVRHGALERGLDMTVREVRLGSMPNADHASLTTAICDAARIIPDCEQNLRLEMVVVDPRNFSAPDPQADCQNAAAAAQPLTNFVSGESNELMLLRACLAFKPVIPVGMFADALAKDAEGYAHLVATSVFVQEPS